jgi:bifunctional N-acetylglucosamine-1-phosphate-uridyltransferase/glucosamine-1-phosphate-acetyltransferase GlmU-like protein
MKPIGFILAAGEGERWNGPFSKQLLKYSEETLVARTARMLKDRDITPVLVSHRQDIVNAVDCETLDPPARRYTTATLLSALLMYRKRYYHDVYVTLGDVLYSGIAMDRLMVTSYIAVGTQAEIFGLRLPMATKRVKVVECLKRAVEQADSGLHWGKLWSFVRNWVGVSSKDTSILIGTGLEHIGDGFTRDFDLLERWETFQQELASGLKEP